MLARASPGVLVERYFTTCSLITCKYGETCTLNSAGRDAWRHIRERRRTPTWTLRSFKRRSRKTQNCRYMKLCYDNAAFATLLTPLSLIQPLRTCLIKSCLSSFSITLFAHWFTPPSANQTDFHHWRASIRRAHFRIGCSQKIELNWERKLLGFFRTDFKCQDILPVNNFKAEMVNSIHPGCLFVNVCWIISCSSLPLLARAPLREKSFISMRLTWFNWG